MNNRHDPHDGRVPRTDATATTLASSNIEHSQPQTGASCSSRTTVGGTGALGPAAEAAAGQAPARAPEQRESAEPGSTQDQPPHDPPATAVPTMPELHRADGEHARIHPEPADPVAGTGLGGRVSPEDFLHEGFAALDRPRLIAEHKGSEVLKPSTQRRRSPQPRSKTPSVRFTPDEITLLEQAAAERGPSLSGFIAEAAVAVATNRITALLPHERAVRAIGEELGRALHAFGKAANNLNQLVRQGHMGIAPVEPERIEDTLNRLDQTIEEIHRATLRLNNPAGQG